MVAIGLLWLLLPSDRQACLTLMAISAAEFPGPRLLLCKIAAGCHLAGRGASPGWGGLPAILLLVPHVQLGLLRKQLQYDGITRLARTYPAPAYPPEEVSEEGAPVTRSSIQHIFVLITVYMRPCLSETSSLMDDILLFLLFNKAMSSTFYVQGAVLSIKEITVKIIK